MMKKLMKTTALFIAIASIAPLTTVAAHDAPAAAEQAIEKTVTFTIDKMTCAMCPITVRKAMEKVEGVSSVKTNYDDKTAVVVFDPNKANLDAIAAASTNAGYPATLVKKESK